MLQAEKVVPPRTQGPERKQRVSCPRRRPGDRLPYGGSFPSCEAVYCQWRQFKSGGITPTLGGFSEKRVCGAGVAGGNGDFVCLLEGSQCRTIGNVDERKSKGSATIIAASRVEFRTVVGECQQVPFEKPIRTRIARPPYCASASTNLPERSTRRLAASAPPGRRLQSLGLSSGSASLTRPSDEFPPDGRVPSHSAAS